MKWNHKRAFTDAASWWRLGVPGAVATPLCSSDELISGLVNFPSWQGDAFDLPSLDPTLAMFQYCCFFSRWRVNDGLIHMNCFNVCLLANMCRSKLGAYNKHGCPEQMLLVFNACSVPVLLFFTRWRANDHLIHVNCFNLRLLANMCRHNYLMHLQVLMCTPHWHCQWQEPQEHFR